MKKRSILIYICLLGASLFSSCSVKDGIDDGVPYFDWMKDVGARSYPHTVNVFNVADYGALGDALRDNTEAIQDAIDACAEAGGGMVTFNPGKYVTGSVFVKSGVDFNIPRGTTLLGSSDIKDYKNIDSRIAGIEMYWPAAIINVIDQENASISGSGTIDGRGKVFWEKYWSMRKDYEKKGLRWIVDYDCERPRGILVSGSKDITVKDIVLYQPGFWSVHVLYSEHVTVDNLIISNNIEGKGPSTDGIDIDSSRKVLVQNCYVNCNDDNLCLKAGRDADGLRVNRPCEYIVIRDCTTGLGAGLFTCGSETSGGIRNVVAYNLKAVGTSYGLRFKSTMKRGGTIEDIYLYNVEMKGVKDPFVVDLNWHPSYSNSLLPEGYKREDLPHHWTVMLDDVDEHSGTPKFKNIYFENVTAVDASTCVKVRGNKNSTIDGFFFKNVSLSGKKPGAISWGSDWTFEDFSVKTDMQNGLKVENSVGIAL